MMDVSINTLERTTDNDIVITAHWNASITDGEFNASAYGSQSFTRTDESPELIPFNDLTEEVVIGWLELGSLEASLLAQIEEKKSPTTAQSVPWS
jgi:hypothetical protein